MEVRTREDGSGCRLQYKTVVLLIVVIALAVRILGVAVLQGWETDGDGQFGFRDGEIGAALAAGQGFSWPDNSYYNQNKPSEPTAWQAPVYPFIIAAAFKVFGIYSPASKVVLLIFQIIISVLMCVLLWYLGMRVFNIWVGSIAALILVFYPSALHLTVEKISSSNLFVFLLLLFIWQLIRLDGEPDWKKSITAGVIFGIAALTDPIIIAFLPFALAWMLFRKGGEYKKWVISCALVFLAACITISPWQIRNYLVFDQVFLIKSNFSRELFAGNFGSLEPGEEPIETLDEGKRNEFFWNRSMGAIRKDPGKLVHRIFDRFIQYWTSLPQSLSSTRKEWGLKELIAGGSYLFILVFGFAGIFFSALKGRATRLLFLVFLSLPLPYYLTWFTHFRYRFPIEPILMIFAGYSLYRLWILLKVGGKPACS